QGQNVYMRGGQWIVLVDGMSGTPARQMAAFQQELSQAASVAQGVQVARHLGLNGFFQIQVSPSTTYETVNAVLRDVPGFRSVEPNLTGRAVEDTIPNDPRFGELYGLRNTGQGGGLPGADIKAPQAWDITTGGTRVGVGVLDTGVDYNHVDLYQN